MPFLRRNDVVNNIRKTYTFDKDGRTQRRASPESINEWENFIGEMPNEVDDVPQVAWKWPNPNPTLGAAAGPVRAEVEKILATTTDPLGHYGRPAESIRREKRAAATEDAPFCAIGKGYLVFYARPDVDVDPLAQRGEELPVWVGRMMDATLPEDPLRGARVIKIQHYGKLNEIN